MKVIYESPYDHWVYKQTVKCSQCTTVFRAESREDFTTGSDVSKVWMKCPKCGYSNRVWQKRTPSVPTITIGSSTNILSEPSFEQPIGIFSDQGPEIIHFPSDDPKKDKDAGLV